MATSNREQNRQYQKMRYKKPLTVPGTQEVVTEAQLFKTEDDLPIWEQTLGAYQIISRYAQCNLRMANILNTVGIEDEKVRQWFHPNIEVTPQFFASVISIVSRRDPRMATDITRDIKAIQGFKQRFTNEDFHEIWSLLDDPEIKAHDVIKELYRHATGMRDLTSMHVLWIKSQLKQPKKKVKKAQKLPETSVNDASAADIHQGLKYEKTFEDKSDSEQSFRLKDTRLFVTENPWRTNDHYLSPVRTDSKNDAIADVEKLCRGSLSIKPISIVNALEFYLDKDIFQKAMAARLRYVDGDQKDWVKIKRGKDRILVKEEKLTEEQTRMIFFVEGRDQVYRDLKR